MLKPRPTKNEMLFVVQGKNRREMGIFGEDAGRTGGKDYNLTTRVSLISRFMMGAGRLKLNKPLLLLSWFTPYNVTGW